MVLSCVVFFFFQAEDGIRDAQESRGLGDVYKRQMSDGGSRYSACRQAPITSRPHLAPFERLGPAHRGLSLIHI